MNLRVRFAPSPTGELHIGGARTALFNFLFARSQNGKFLVRIEDTDIQRSRKEYIEQICNSLEWLGLSWDDELVFQSKRTELYRHAIDLLLKEGKAYRCFASKDDLEKSRAETGSYQYSGIWRDRSEKEIENEISKGTPFTIRLRSPLSGVTKIEDIIYGTIHVSNSELDDFIIMRSDGSPVYNLVVVVDDHGMDISHVIRGEDHVSNTPKQILLYKALKWDLPVFAHLPMILGSDGKRLSKRHGATGIQAYRDQGYQSEALLNYLALLGWNPDTKQEIMNLVQLTKKFRLDQVHKKSAVFDKKKLDWISGQHLGLQKSEHILIEIRNIYPGWGNSKSNDYCYTVIDLLKPRSKSLLEIIEQSEYFFKNFENFNWDDINFILGNDTLIILKSLSAKLNLIDPWDLPSIEEQLKILISENSFSFGKIMKVVRFIICGKDNGPSLYNIIYILGKDCCNERLNRAIKSIENI